MPDDHNPDKPPFEGRTFLLIRTHPLDDGTEPLASGLPFWVSPDVTIVKPDGTSGGEAVAGATNQVQVLVTNKGGIAAVDAYVDAFVADPSTAFTPASAAPVGSSFVTVPGYSAVTVGFPWVPPPSAAGHRCLLARVSLVIPPDTYVDGAVFDVVGDRHVAQRNIHVVSLSAAQKSLSFAFAVVNPLGAAAEFALEARELKLGRATAAAAQRALGCTLPARPAAPLRGLGVTFDEPARDDSGDDGRRPGREPEPFGVLRGRPLERPRRKASLALEASETRRATITVAAGEQRGGINLVEIRQVAADRTVVGGLWLAVVSG